MVRQAILGHSTDFVRKLKGLAPVDKGDLKEAWDEDGFTETPISISTHISNDLIYAPVIERGSKPGYKPWPTAREKTVQRNGRIWSTQAIGGTLDKVVNNRSATLIMKDVGKAIVRAFR